MFPCTKLSTLSYKLLKRKSLKGLQPPFRHFEGVLKLSITALIRSFIVFNYMYKEECL